MGKEIVKLDLPSNSHKSKEVKIEEKTEIKKVVKTPVKRKKKSIGKKFSEVFMEDDTKSVGSYLINDVLIPAAKDTIVDLISSGIEMLMFGSDGGARKKSSSYGRKSGYTSYNSISDGKKKSRSDYKYQNRYVMDEIIVDTRGEAYEIIRELEELIEQYGSASVSDLNDLIGETGEWTDNKWGWFDLGSSKIVRVRDGYLVDLPRVKPLD